MDFDALLPQIIYDAISTQGYHPTGWMIPLNSYENRVYEIHVEDREPLVAKFYRPRRWSEEQLTEEHRFVAAIAAAEIPCVEPLPLEQPLNKRQRTLGKSGEYFYAIFPKFRGRCEADLSNDHRKWLGRSLARLHNVGAAFPSRHRAQLDPQTYGYNCLDKILAQPYAPDDMRSPLEDVILMALSLVEERYAPGILLQPVHGDVHWGNVLWNADGPTLLDFDDMVLAPPVQDLWMLFNGKGDEIEKQREAFFEGYETFRKFDHATLSLTESLRTLRMICYASWIGHRYEEEMFKRAFPYYHERRYWEEFLLSMKEQISLLQES